VFARLYICLLLKRTDKIESGGTNLRMCPMISLGISTSVMAGGADSGCGSPKSASGCAINSASTNTIISDNDSRNMLIMSVVVIVTNVVCVV